MSQKTKRTIPLRFKEASYNLNDGIVLRDIIESTFCELMDTNHYSVELSQMEEEYDETLELHQFNDWLYGSDDEGNPFTSAKDSLANSNYYFNEITEIKREEFIFLIDSALHFPGDTLSKYLFGQSEKVENIDSFIECMEECLFDLDDMYVFNLPNQKESLKDFMKDVLSNCD